ncbi:MAG TPA: hypothetical protein PLU37_06290 [Chitinophagaceae bacterium]|nr:hypothetical protein [Chitinophagaceae bacterium]MCB9054828.1 hypothetical protein [Chitinophagales bacterium]HPG11118.1 hypothetical protein [Chitinophagaceae bacterium]HRX94748.1 hypothetical protein [Chitinophagaceae bacterium]
MKKLVFLSSIVLQFLITTAQTESEIEKYSNEVDRKIDSGTLHQNQWVTNKNGSDWFDPGSSYYEVVTDFWYDGTGFLNDETGIPEFQLVKISSMQKSILYNRKEEYLFQNGHLNYFYLEMNVDGAPTKLHYYINSKGNVIKETILVDDKKIDKNDSSLEDYKKAWIISPEKMVLKAKKYQKLFFDSILMEQLEE